MPENDAFEVQALDLHSVMIEHGNKAIFEIPEYQRKYNWSKDNIKRLLEDCLEGFSHSESTHIDYTFLGALILSKSLKHADGHRYVVDGQQRLTTLTLLCCALIEEMDTHKDDINSLPQSIKPLIEWN